MPRLAIFGKFFAIFRPLTLNKTSPNYFFLVEEVLSFNLVGYLWKLVKNWVQKCIFYLGEIFLHILELSLSNISEQHLLVTSTSRTSMWTTFVNFCVWFLEILQFHLSACNFSLNLWTFFSCSMLPTGVKEVTIFTRIDYFKFRRYPVLLPGAVVASWSLTQEVLRWQVRALLL